MWGKNSVHICGWLWCWRWWRWWWREQQPILLSHQQKHWSFVEPTPWFPQNGRWTMPTSAKARYHPSCDFYLPAFSVSPRGLGRDPIFKFSGPIQFSHLVSGVVVEWPVCLGGACISGSYKCSTAKQSIMCWKPIIKWCGLISQMPDTSTEAFPGDRRPAWRADTWEPMALTHRLAN